MQWVAKAVQTLATGWHGLLGIGIFMLVISGFIIVNTMVSYFFSQAEEADGLGGES